MTSTGPPDQKPTAPRTRRALRLLARATAAAILALVLLEVLLRTLFHPSFEYDRLVENDPWRWIRFRPGVEDVLTNQVPSAVNAKCEYPTNVRVSRQGLRADREYFPSPTAGTLRILCLGDSITMGWGVEVEYSYPVLLEQELTRRDPGRAVEVINAGFASYSSRQGLIWLDRELLSFQPKVVIVQFGFNDSLATWQRMVGPLRFVTDREVMAGRPGEWRDYAPGPLDQVTAFLDRTHTARVGLMIGTVARGWVSPDRDREGRSLFSRARVPPADYRDNLGEMIRLCNERGARVILLETWGSPPEYQALVHEIGNRTGTTVVSQTKIVGQAMLKKDELLSSPEFQPYLEPVHARCLDSNFLDANPIYFFLVDYLHPSEISNALLARELADVINTPPNQPAP